MVEGVGEVYAGTVVSGTVAVGDHLLLGPTGPNGAFLRTAVASVHVARLAVRRASAGQTASFTLVADPEDDRNPAANPTPAATPGFDRHVDASAVGGGKGLFSGGGAMGKPEAGGLMASALGGCQHGADRSIAAPEITFVTPNDAPSGSSSGSCGRGAMSSGSDSSDNSWNDGSRMHGESDAAMSMGEEEAEDEENGEGRCCQKDGGGSPRALLSLTAPCLNAPMSSTASGDYPGEDDAPTAWCEDGGGIARTSTLLFDGGGWMGDGESPGRRTRKGMVLVEVRRVREGRDVHQDILLLWLRYEELDTVHNQLRATSIIYRCGRLLVLPARMMKLR